ncbi:MAG: hypothetical protein HYT65_03125 [Candidatus Yanofskybacteria bacterium]|nr:hypothetical protein [Candidatus Yanofskybacteria bacterium]
MTNRKVQDIFAEELTGKSVREALMSSQNRIALEILEKLIPAQADDPAWKLLKDIACAKSRLCMFMGFISDSLVRVDNGVLEEAVFLHRIWLQAVTFLYENYDNLDSEEFRKGWDKETTLEVKNELAKKCEDLSQQLVTTKTLSIHHQDFRLMDQTFNWTLLAVLGSELFKQFMEEFNKTGVLLRKFQTELLTPSA